MGKLKEISEKIKSTTQERARKVSETAKKEKERRQEIREERDKKFNNLKKLTNDELMKIARKFISSSPKVVEETETGKQKTRSPTRMELIDTILVKVPNEAIERILPGFTEGNVKSKPTRTTKKTPKKTSSDTSKKTQQTTNSKKKSTSTSKSTSQKSSASTKSKKK